MGRANRLHHTVPATYLSGFAQPQTRNGQLFLLDNKSLDIRPGTPDSILKDSDFYLVKTEQGGTLKIEKDFLQSIESDYADLYKNILSKYIPLDSTSKARLAVFTASLMLRVPAIRETWQDFFNKIKEHVEIIDSLSDEQKKTMGSVMPSSGQSRDSIPASEVIKIASDIPSFHSRGLPQNVYDIAPIIYQMNCALLVSCIPEKRFITSDNPCIMANPHLEEEYGAGVMVSSPGLGQTHVELTLPISSKIAVIWGWQLKDDGNYDPISRESKSIWMIDEFNKRQLRNSKKIVAEHKNQLEDIVRLINQSKSD